MLVLYARRINAEVMTVPKIRTHYDNMQVSKTASDSVIRGAFRGLSQQHHPDKNPNDRAGAERRMRIINAAYAVLSDPERRREHDQWIMRMEADAPTERQSAEAGSSRIESAYDRVIYPKKLKLLRNLLIAGVFVAIGVSLIDSGTEANWMAKTARFITVYIGIPLFGLMGLACLMRIINPSPSLIINENGIQVLTFGGATLRWSEISRIGIEVYEKSRFLTVFPEDPASVMKRQSLLGRMATRFNASFMGRPQAIVISEDMVGMSLEALMEEITSRMPGR